MAAETVDTVLHGFFSTDPSRARAALEALVDATRGPVLRPELVDPHGRAARDGLCCQHTFGPLVDDTCACDDGIRSALITDPAILAHLQAGSTRIRVVAKYLYVSWVRVTVDGTAVYDVHDPFGNAGVADLCDADYENDVYAYLDVYREACDDGNDADGDGCSSACIIEGCGNGIIEPDTEECDRGALNGAGGCSPTCTLTACGDGVLDPAEQCDDGGTDEGDGCDGYCRVEVCGNGFLQDEEQCDDGNLVRGDGCTSGCRIEECGDGILNVGEQCDDGDYDDNDGCSANCEIEACTPGTDSDLDRLDDCVETNSGRFVDANDTGTSPFVADSDGDGIDDGDEVLGTLDGLDLHAMGANPNRRDIFVEVDWLATDAAACPSAPPTHEPSLATYELLADMFAAAPTTNRDGSRGISLWLDYGQGGAFMGGGLVPGDDYLEGGVDGAQFFATKADHFANARRGYFHYLLVGRAFNAAGNGGQAELSGDDIIVTRGCPGFEYANISTFAHELGHNLGLGHGGNESCNYKPNYASIMNYRYDGPDHDCDGISDGLFDFSRGRNAPLVESNLAEGAGICGGVAQDWNGNGSIEAGVSFDLNAEDPSQALTCGGTITTLRDYDDWSNLNLIGVTSSPNSARTPVRIITCF